MQDLTPKQTVEKLDRYIIGQKEAKRAVAVAIRNRWRRRQLSEDMSGEVYPKNIIMIGPTGVGKTEIARRLATLTGAPFIKVEASKFTEVGYHGRDVESMVRDLLDHSISMVRTEQAESVSKKAQEAAIEKVIDLLLPGSEQPENEESDDEDEIPTGTGTYVESNESRQRHERARKRLREQLEAGKLDEREVELSTTNKPSTSVMFANMGLDQMDPEMSNMFERMIPEQTQTRRTSVAEAKRILREQETEKLLDQEKIHEEAISRTQNSGIVFLDEIDKVATPSEGKGGSGSPDISRQGVQRDLLPIVEGSAVTTRYGIVHTDHILFIAAGAFHSATVSDLMPELQGRFPIRVELAALNHEDLKRILTEPKNSLTKQQKAMLKVEGLKIEFEASAIDVMAELAAKANTTMENIGARRLTTIVERLFEQINFDAPEMVKEGKEKIVIDGDFVRKQVESIVEDKDLSQFVL